MTRDQILTKVQETLDDTAGVFFQGTDLQNSIQDGYDEVALLSECIEKSGDVSFQNDLVYYDLSLAIPDYFRVFAIFNNNNKRWLNPVSYDKLQLMNPLWEIAHGEPIWFAPIGFKHVAFYPHANIGNGNFTVYHSALADTLAGDSSPQIPETYEDVLEFYCIQDLYQQNQEYSKALISNTKYEDHLDKLIEYMESRQMPDRIVYLLGNKG